MPAALNNCLLVDESEVRRAVLTFPAGSAGGPDFLRPQHIRDLMMCQETGHDFLSLTAFVNLVLSGRCPSEVAPIAHPKFSTTDALLQSFTRVDVCDASLLGAPLFHGSELDKSWNGCCDDLARAAERLRDIGCQDALILLRSSFSAPKVLHLLRFAPSVSHAALDLRLSVARLYSTNNQLKPIRHSVAAGQPSG